MDNPKEAQPRTGALGLGKPPTLKSIGLIRVGANANGLRGVSEAV